MNAFSLHQHRFDDIFHFLEVDSAVSIGLGADPLDVLVQSLRLQVNEAMD